MQQYPHLKFIQKIEGKPRLFGGGAENQKSIDNKANREAHASSLQDRISALKKEWDDDFNQREENGLASLEQDVKPIFLQINPDIINLEFDLASFGIEIISEEEDGFIIGASIDNFRTLEDKINGFIKSKYGTAKIADFWQIFQGDRSAWKPRHILSESLFAKWSEINDDDFYNLEVSIAFDKPIGNEPDPNKIGGPKRLEEYRRELEKRDDLLVQREFGFEQFIRIYGSLTSSIVNLDDSFGCEVRITGKGLKDLVMNYPFVFEVSEVESVGGIEGEFGSVDDVDIEIYPPSDDASEVAVVDSGIMEEHRYLSVAIKPNMSKSYLEGDASTADYVNRGGHGTKVAGAILYPRGITSITQPYQLPCFIRNIRVLDGDNQLRHKYPAELMKTIVEDNPDIRIYNLSIGSNTPCKKKHMSSWASILDFLSYKNDVLFLIATGNIPFVDIKNFLNQGGIYPSYLLKPYCRISNPAQSSFGITVGSVNSSLFSDENYSSLGDVNEISAYSRVGLGIWEHIKPDVVEYGGGVVRFDDGTNNVKEHAETATELVCSTFHGGRALGRDSVGTSFSTPKVANIAAKLSQLYPNEGMNLIRALIVQGARLPGVNFQNPTLDGIRFFGYGIPSLERVTENSEHRVTFYNTNDIKADEGHLYSLKVPNLLRDPADDFDILIEVSLAYFGKIRRTRQKTKSYLSTWLDWDSSKIGESFDEFKDYALKEIENKATVYDSNIRNAKAGFDWKIRQRNDNGIIGVNRNNSTLQKDWVIIKSHELPEELSFVVKGHKGWDKTRASVPYALTVSIEVLGQNIPIYEAVRIENQIEIQTEI